MLNKVVVFTSAFACSPVLATVQESQLADRVEVTATKPVYQTTLSKVLPQHNVLDYSSFSADSLANLLSQAPAVSFNGQGGLFQTVNIRGFSRWRIQTLVEGIPIYSERRAGTAAEFIPPAFVEQIYLTPGAASTQLGSGAIGGGMDMQLAIPQQTRLQLNYGHNQSFREAVLQGTTQIAEADKLSWLVNHRHANNSQDGAGLEILDGYEQQALTLRHQSSHGLLRESLLLYSSANNIAKASADLASERFTLYPHNNHLLAKLSFDWHNLFVYAHDTDLQTRVTRPGRRLNLIDNQALDWGAKLSGEFDWHNWQFQWRSTLDMRSGVKAYEAEFDANKVSTVAGLTLDAEQRQGSVALEMSQSLDKSVWAVGTHLAYQWQKDHLANDSQRDTNLSAFAGYSYNWDQQWRISTYLSNAYRVPSLTERFFNGTTPRGKVLGDPNLKTETANNLEVAVSHTSAQSDFSLSLFHQEIKHYIERLTLNEALRQYRNLQRATIRGINYQWQYQTEYRQLDWRLSLSGQWLWAEGNNNQAIADIAPAKHRLGLNVFSDRGQGFVALTYRQASDDIVAGELPTSTVATFDMGYTLDWSSKIQLKLNVTNLTDKLYVTSRDDLAPFARGRDIHIGVSYTL